MTLEQCVGGGGVHFAYFESAIAQPSTRSFHYHHSLTPPTWTRPKANERLGRAPGHTSQSYQIILINKYFVLDTNTIWRA